MNIYGRSGTGKTTLWSTFPGPILAAICSGGDKPGELRSIDTPANRKKISQVVIQQSGELREVLSHVSVTRKYATVILDHATGLQDLVLKEVLGLEQIPAQKGWGLASQQQYGQCTMQCKELFRLLLGVDCNVVIVAQEREFNTDSESSLIAPYVGAGLTPSLTGWLNTAVDYICQTFIRQKEVEKVVSINGKQLKRMERSDEVEYVLRTGPSAVYTTKFRTPRRAESQLPALIIDPHYDKIIAAIRPNDRV